MKKTVRYLLAIILILGSFFGGSAYALSLDQAKAQGQIGEQLNGYLGAIESPTSEISSLISNINQQRKAKYQEIAKKNGTSLSAVEALAAKKALEETPPGRYIQDASGTWVKK